MDDITAETSAGKYSIFIPSTLVLKSEIEASNSG